MGVVDKFLNAIRLNDDYDDEDDFIDEEDEEIEDEKPKKKFFKKFRAEEDDFEEEEEAPKASKAPKKVKQPERDRVEKVERASSPKVTPLRKPAPSSASMEVCVIKPVSMEETREIADTLRDRCTVVLNLEGIDVELAQRIIDFSSGACYALDGSLQMISSYIFIMTPRGVEISGDIQDILNGASSHMRTQF